MKSNKDHWENIYKTKKPGELSWTEEVPETSLAFIHSFQLPKTARIIDIGGGDSKLVDFLLNEGFVNLTVLDLSKNSIEKAKMRLGKEANKINWIVQDVTEFQSDTPFDCWHDRAAFHFLTKPDQITRYVSIARQHIRSNGYAVISTFSENGPEKRSGLSIKQYSQESLTLALSNDFEKLNCLTHDHEAPFDTKQSFLYCAFRKS